MQGKKTSVFTFLFMLISFFCFAQTDYISLGNKQYGFLDRLDIKLQNDSVLSFSTMKPFDRKKITRRVLYLDSLDKSGALPIELSDIDRYNLRSLVMNNSEWAPGYEDSFKTRKPLFNAFFKTPAHFFEKRSNDFVVIADPVLNLQIGKERTNGNSLYVNTRGILIKGQIDNRVGFYTYITENQERDPLYVQAFVQKNHAVPGEGYYKKFGTNGYDYFDARGGISFNAGKYFDFQFAYDKLFIGNGYRSLLLSDFSSNYLYFKMNTQIAKFNYQTVFAQTTAPFGRFSDTLRPKNYMMLHHLSLQVTRWLNIGVYENVMYNDHNGIELAYLNPVIFYRSIEQQLGSSGKANIGLDFKANAVKNMQFYGQLLINEFVTNEVLHYKRGNWRNKQGAQLGVKYIDAFTIKNLDLQLEGNWVRPFTYTHNDSTTAFTNYNQPLAHPLGANFEEYIALAKYQPIPKLYLFGKLIYYKQGLDSAGQNFGSNIFRSYNSRVRDYHLYIGSGIPVKSMQASLTASYELLENLYVEGNATYRTYNVVDMPNTHTFYYTVGLRWNIARRDFDF